MTELQKQVSASQPTNWLKQITASFKDEPAFEGRVIRSEGVAHRRHRTNSIFPNWVLKLTQRSP